MQAHNSSAGSMRFRHLTHRVLAFLRLSVAAIIVVIAMSANAELLDRGNGLIYDSDLDITWLYDANFGEFGAETTIFEAREWAHGLVYAGFDDWRLPKMLAPDPVNWLSFMIGCRTDGICTDSELGRLYYLTLNGQYQQAPDFSQTPFINVQTDLQYWMDTFSGGCGIAACYWFFHMDGIVAGRQNEDVGFAYAWAVRDGDVLPTPESVRIDIKPNKSANCNRSISVAILGSDTIDVTQVDPMTLSFEELTVRERRNGSLACKIRDVNKDGYYDFVCRYQDAAVDGTLTGELFDGTPIIGTDSLCIAH